MYDTYDTVEQTEFGTTKARKSTFKSDGTGLAIGGGWDSKEVCVPLSLSPLSRCVCGGVSSFKFQVAIRSLSAGSNKDQSEHLLPRSCIQLFFSRVCVDAAELTAV